MDISELRTQHQDIIESAARLAEAIADATMPQSVSAIRWQLARKLMAHLALEDRILYPAMQRQDDERLRAAAARIQADIGALAETFAKYMSAWSDERIAREWPDFCAETTHILKALSDRVSREEHDLYPLADRMTSPSSPVTRAG